MVHLFRPALCTAVVLQVGWKVMIILGAQSCSAIASPAIQLWCSSTGRKKERAFWGPEFLTAPPVMHILSYYFKALL